MEQANFGGAKDFCPNSPNSKKSDRQKKLFVILGAIFSNQSMLGAIFARVCSDFQGFCEDSEILSRFPGILPGFSPNQNFWGCACTPASYTTGQSHSEIIRLLLSSLLAQVCTASMLSKSEKILMSLNSKQKSLCQLAITKLYPKETKKRVKSRK